MQNLEEHSLISRFHDFRKRPFDGLDKRTVYQFWPAFESELKRKGLSPVLDLKFNPLPTEPTASLRKVAHDETAMTALVVAYDLALTAHSQPKVFKMIWLIFWTTRSIILGTKFFNFMSSSPARQLQV